VNTHSAKECGAAGGGGRLNPPQSVPRSTPGSAYSNPATSVSIPPQERRGQLLAGANARQHIY
jgi:hypothetical protein